MKLQGNIKAINRLFEVYRKDYEGAMENLQKSYLSDLIKYQDELLLKISTDYGLNYEELAKATENYVSSDIKFLCDEASRKALKENTRITKIVVLETIRNNKPSISLQELNSYLVIKAKMDGESNNANDRPSIGFRT